MAAGFERKLRFVARRESLNRLISRLVLVLTFAAVVAVLGIMAEKLLAVSIVSKWTLWGFWGVVAVVVLIPWLFNLPDRMQAALMIDRELKLKERFSTSIALAQSQDPFAVAARAEARKRAKDVDLRRKFPFRAPKQLPYMAAMWTVAFALALFMPQKDLLGMLKKQHQQQTQEQQKKQVTEEVAKATSSVESAVSELNDPNVADKLANLARMPEGIRPQDIKRQAIRKLGELSDEIKNMQKTTDLGSMNMLQQMFKQLKGSKDSFSQQLRNALAKGDFSKARDLVAELQKKLAEGKMDPADEKSTAEQLAKLAKELQELADKKSQLEDELQKQGLDKELAKLSPDQLRQALKKRGLDNETIEKLMQKASACKSAGGKCSAMAQALAGSCSGGSISASELGEMLEQLNELEAMEQQLAAMEASLAEISRAVAGLGEGMCEGLGGQSEFSEGMSNRYGRGSGGPGRGYGPRDSDSDGETYTSKTVVKTDPKDGPAIASWYFKDTQIKGEARRDFSEVVTSGRDRAAEAISNNQIPRKYEKAVKDYFGALEESGARQE